VVQNLKIAESSVFIFSKPSQSKILSISRKWMRYFQQFLNFGAAWWYLGFKVKF